jgi:hypothetical protein
MSSTKYSGTAELRGKFTIMIEGGYFYMDDFLLDSVICYSDDSDLDESEFNWLDEMYGDFIKEAKKSLSENGIVVTEDTYAFADFDYTVKTDYHGYWDDGFWYNSDHFELPDGDLVIGENYFDIDVTFKGIEYDEDE